MAQWQHAHFSVWRCRFDPACGRFLFAYLKIFAYVFFLTGNTFLLIFFIKNIKIIKILQFIVFYIDFCIQSVQKKPDFDHFWQNFRKKFFHIFFSKTPLQGFFDARNRLRALKNHKNASLTFKS